MARYLYRALAAELTKPATFLFSSLGPARLGSAVVVVVVVVVEGFSWPVSGGRRCRDLETPLFWRPAGNLPSAAPAAAAATAATAVRAETPEPGTGENTGGAQREADASGPVAREGPVRVH